MYAPRYVCLFSAEKIERENESVTTKLRDDTRGVEAGDGGGLCVAIGLF
jgi:hypothetical protein